MKVPTRIREELKNAGFTLVIHTVGSAKMCRIWGNVKEDHTRVIFVQKPSLMALRLIGKFGKNMLFSCYLTTKRITLLSLNQLDILI